MQNLYVAQPISKVLRNESPMTILCCGLTAQKTCVIQITQHNLAFDLTVTHQSLEGSLVFLPIHGSPFIVVKDGLSRRKSRAMFVVALANLPKKKGKIISFCKSSKLRDIIETNVDQSLNTHFA